MGLRALTIGMLVAALLPLASPARAEPAYAAKTAHLRAGPGRSYPVVAVLPSGLPVEILGCVAGYTWCDVIAGRQRGWVYARNLWHRHGDVDGPVLDHGAEIGIAIVGFLLLDYWRDHYRDRPWYGDRNRWAHPPRPPGPPPAPPPQPPRPPRAPEPARPPQPPHPPAQPPRGGPPRAAPREPKGGQPHAPIPPGTPPGPGRPIPQR